MDNDRCFLVTFLYQYTLIRCALRVRSEDLPEGCCDEPMEQENLRAIHDHFPLYVRSLGPIVCVEPLFAVHVAGSRCPVDGGGDDHDQ